MDTAVKGPDLVWKVVRLRVVSESVVQSIEKREPSKETSLWREDAGGGEGVGLSPSALTLGADSQEHTDDTCDRGAWSAGQFSTSDGDLNTVPSVAWDHLASLIRILLVLCLQIQVTSPSFTESQQLNSLTQVEGSKLRAGFQSSGIFSGDAADKFTLPGAQSRRRTLISIVVITPTTPRARHSSPPLELL